MIIRRKRHRQYTIIANEVADDDRLGFEALGLLTYLLSRPDNWSVHVKQLCKRGGCGRDKTRRILNELIAAGYVVRQKIRSVEGGQFVRGDYEVHDIAQPIENDGPENPPLATDAFSGAGKRVPIINTNPKQYLPSLPPNPVMHAERVDRPIGLAVGVSRQACDTPKHRDRGETEALIGERLGPNGLELLMNLPLSEVDHLCSMQRRGILHETKLHELRAGIHG